MMPSNSRTYRIGYAESLDGIHWERSPLNPVMDKTDGDGFDNERSEYPEIQKHDDGTYRMWFCGNPFGSVGYAEGIKAPWNITVRTRLGNVPHEPVDLLGPAQPDRLIELDVLPDDFQPRPVAPVSRTGQVGAPLRSPSQAITGRIWEAVAL